MAMSIEAIIYHIALLSDFENRQADDDYQCASFTQDGFIHCCEQEQLSGVVSRYYSGIDDVTLLLIDVDKLIPALIRENTMGGSELFPHIYGPINAEAIIEAIPFGLQSIERLGLVE